MTKEELAEKLNGIDYGDLVKNEFQEIAKENDLVFVFGASDDLVEFRGAIYGEAYFSNEGIFLDLSNRKILGDKIKNIKDFVLPFWCNTEPYTWSFETMIHHATFEVLENGRPMQRGIVFNVIPNGDVRLKLTYDRGENDKGEMFVNYDSSEVMGYLEDMLENCEIGEKMTIEIVKMSKQEYEALPESSSPFNF